MSTCCNYSDELPKRAAEIEKTAELRLNFGQQLAVQQLLNEAATLYNLKIPGAEQRLQQADSLLQRFLVEKNAQNLG